MSDTSVLPVSTPKANDRALKYKKETNCFQFKTPKSNYLLYLPYIGRGTFSKVYYGKDEIGNEIAIKCVTKSKVTKVELSYVHKEIEIMKKLSHPNIIKLIDTLDTDKHIYIISEYCNYKTLTELFEIKLTEIELHHIIKQLCSALHYIRSKNIYHKDLKPQNIFMNRIISTAEWDILDIEIKLGDFGFAKQTNLLELNETLCGTPLYLAPEIMINHQYHTTSDLWSLGIIIYQLAFSKHPFGNPKTRLELERNINILAGKILNDTKDIYSESFENLISELIQINPNKRMNWEQLQLYSWFSRDSETRDSETRERANANQEMKESNPEESTIISNSLIPSSLNIIRDKLKENCIKQEKSTEQDDIPKGILYYTKPMIINDFYSRGSEPRGTDPRKITHSTPIAIPTRLSEVKDNEISYVNLSDSPNVPSSPGQSSPILHSSRNNSLRNNSSRNLRGNSDTTPSTPSSLSSNSSMFANILKQTLRFISNI
jgi:serine/threonine protein kinase